MDPKTMVLALLLFSSVLCTFATGTNQCEERETVLANLQLAKQSISKAKNLHAQNESREAESVCASKTYVGFLNVAMNLVTDSEERVKASFPPSRADKPIDCGDVWLSGERSSGEYDVWPRSRLLHEGRSALRVFCDMDTAQGGWTVIQRRGNFENQEDFYVEWQKYKLGFGNVSRDFWLGNDNIFAISNQGAYQIRFDLQDVDQNRAYAEYDTFWIDDETYMYKLHIGNYSGNAGDSMEEHNGQPFSTRDRRNDKAPGEACALTRRSAWWFLNCAKANLNGLYRPGTLADYKSMYWYHWKKLDGLSVSEIKVRRKSVVRLMGVTPAAA